MEKKFELCRYYLGEGILIGHRDDDTMFWLKTNDIDFHSDVKELDIVEAGKAWIDEQSDTTILEFPTKDKEEFNKLANEFFQRKNRISDYIKSEFYVPLANCVRSIPIELDHKSIDYNGYHHNIPEYTEGYILNEDTFLMKNTETGEFSYTKFSKFTMNDFKVDRFGWVKTARKYYSCASDAELFLELRGYAKESTGEAWIDEKNDVLVLGPVSGQTPENFDNFFFDRVLWYLGTFPKWNQTQYWIDIESGLKDNPFDKQAIFFGILDKYMM